jgi:hypothetical protein
MISEVTLAYGSRPGSLNRHFNKAQPGELCATAFTASPMPILDIVGMFRQPMIACADFVNYRHVVDVLRDQVGILTIVLYGHYSDWPFRFRLLVRGGPCVRLSTVVFGTVTT